MGSVKIYHTLLSCGHTIHHKKQLPDGDTLICNECGEWVDVKTPADIAVGQTYHPDYDCTTEPVLGKRGYYRAKCQKDSCDWEREARYHATMEGMHKHQTNSHSRWGNPMLTLEGF